MKLPFFKLSYGSHAFLIHCYKNVNNEEVMQHCVNVVPIRNRRTGSMADIIPESVAKPIASDNVSRRKSDRYIADQPSSLLPFLV